MAPPLKPDKFHRVQVNLTPSQHAWLQAQSTDTGFTQSELVRAALDAYISKTDYENARLKAGWTRAMVDGVMVWVKPERKKRSLHPVNQPAQP